MGGTRRAPLLLCPRVLRRPFCHFTDKGGNRLDRRVSFLDVLLLIKKRAPSPLPKMADVSTEEKVSLRVGNWTCLSAGGPHTEARGLTRFWIPAARGPSASHGHSHGASLSWRSLSWSLAAWLALRPPGPPVRPDLRERPPSSPRVAPGARGRGGGHTLGPPCQERRLVLGKFLEKRGASHTCAQVQNAAVGKGLPYQFHNFSSLILGTEFLTPAPKR